MVITITFTAARYYRIIARARAYRREFNVAVVNVVIAAGNAYTIAVSFWSSLIRVDNVNGIVARSGNNRVVIVNGNTRYRNVIVAVTDIYNSAFHRDKIITVAC